MDDLKGEDLEKRIKAVQSLQFERVGQKIGINLVVIRQSDSSSAANYAQVVKKVTDKLDLPPVLIASSPESLEEALKVCAKRKPLIYAADSNNCEAVAKLAKDHSCPLAVKGNGLEELASLTEKISSLGVKDLVLDSGRRDLVGTISHLTQIRRLALRRTYRPLGYPTMAFTSEKDPLQEVAQASAYIAKYASIVVIEAVEPWQILPLLTLRQNIYTDPQKPIQVEPKIYEVGSVTDKSPVLVTTNFSLTYFTVEGDVEASKVPSLIAVVDTEGTSVLTAWAAEKFTAESIAGAVKKYAVAEKVSHQKLIIPGFVAVLSGKLEEELPGWKILVGPRESSGIPAYLKNTWES